MVTLQLRQLDVPPGHRVKFHDVEWDEFEAILEEMGEHRGTRIAYDNGILEIMTPLPEHESDKEIIGDLLKAFLEECDVDFLTLGSTTFKNPQTLKGIEPDQCFYIQNEASVRGKKRLDLSIDPPPDLALEIDITSRTHPATYASLRVPELWRREGDRIQIYVLQSEQYVEVEDSPTFSGWYLHTVIPQYVEQSRSIGRNKTMRAFRAWVRAELEKRG
ncbi:Uma2 family endonuclease [Oculatella sp. LEGE 06141]|uniref:Uma2 family endonuclease n=1 Tax=Oculatella sp. LEGE 06141 TaxID=1828648 RepID=UPI00187F022B|nr:Uma2 family endonuclease [Oculatella sp. LEGE 06141]MBE9180349.1 Uma2 family endonuclease [Oculatella sp. LEGE 06141]